MFAQASGYGLDGPDAQRTAMDVTVQAHMGVSPSNVYPCSDGHIALIAAMNSHWRAVLEVIGRADLLGDERLRTNAGRCLR